MFEFLALNTPTLAGAALVLLVLVFFRFGHGFVDLLLSHTSSPVEAVEQSIREQE